jgi:hypothetical protein
MAFFVTKKSASLQVAAPSGARYMVRKDVPVEVQDAADIANFRSRRDSLVETDASGNPVAPAPTHGGTISNADLGMASSYRKFGASKSESQPLVDPRVAGEAQVSDEKEPEMKVRRSSPKPAEETPPVEKDATPDPEPEPEPEPEGEPEVEPESDLEADDSEGDEGKDADGE